MSMDVVIKVDPGDSIRTANAVESALAKVESQGASSGAAATKGFRESSVAAEKAKVSAMSLGEQLRKMANPFGGNALADQLKREADMFEKIRGPAREYGADLKALDMLLHKNAISAKEYADQVAVLNRRIGETPASGREGGGTHHGLEMEGSLPRAVLGNFGEFGSLLDTLTSKGAIETAGVVALGVELVHISDEYTQAANQAQRLVGATGDYNGAIDRQLDLAGDLHASLEQTMELSIAVAERTKDLGLTQEQTTNFTRELGQIAEMSGKSVGEAAGVWERLSFALESGLPAGRQMKDLMREFPPLAEALSEGMGKSTKEIIELAQKGRLSLKDIYESMAAGQEGVTVDFRHHAETFGQMWEHTKDRVNVATGEMLDNIKTNASDATQSMAKGFADMLGVEVQVEGHTLLLSERWDKMNASMGFSTHALEENTKAAEDWLKTYFHVDAMHAELALKIPKVAAEWALLANDMLTALDKWLTNNLGDHKPIQAHVAALSDEQKMIEKLNGPLEEQSRGIAALGHAYGDGAISLKQYNEELQKLYDLVPSGALPNSITGGQLGGQGTGGVGQVANFGPNGDVMNLHAPTTEESANNAYLADVEAQRLKRQMAYPTEMWKKELADYQKDAEERNKMIAEAFQPVEDALVHLVKTGKLDLASFEDQFESMLIKMSFDKIKNSVTSLFEDATKGMATSTATGTATGTSAASTMLAAAPGIGASIGAAFSIAAQAGAAGAGATRGAVEAAVQAGASAYGSETTIPHAATGYNARIGGSGGTDSQLFMSWVTPGEHVSIKTPEQQRAAEISGGGKAPLVVQVVNQHNVRGELAYVLSSGQVDKQIVNVIRSNLGAIQALLKGRK